MTIESYLAAELQTKLERHGVVVWDDPECSYAGTLKHIVPASVTTVSFTGSWYALRREIEPLLVGLVPPSLLVYIPGSVPNPDPLEELRAVGARFRITLPTLLRKSLAGSIAEPRILQIARQCSTIEEAQAAVEGGASNVHARLIAIVGDSSATTVVASILGRGHEAEIAAEDLADAARHLMNETLGVDLADGLEGDALSNAAFRHITLALMTEAVTDLAETLDSAFCSPTTSQLKACKAVVNILRADPGLQDSYVSLATQADEDLHLVTRLAWDDPLVDVDVSPALEDAALKEGVRRLEAGEFDTALDLANSRSAASWWVRSGSPNGDTRAIRWRAISALAKLGRSLDLRVPVLTSLAQQQAWYETEGWEVDSAFRHAEFLRVTAGVALDELDGLFHDGRSRYEAWLDKTLQQATAVLNNVVLPQASLQRTIYDRHIKMGGDRCAYLLVDALRYELGRDLAKRLETVNADITIESAIATPPSITPVGMAALLPGSAAEYEIVLTDKNRLEVRVGGTPIRTVGDRRRCLEHAHGKVVDLNLDQVAQLTNKELKKKLTGASLTLVRSTEIDSEGESDQLAASWGSFDATLSVLHTAVAKLLHAGIQRVVITSDHGFLAVRELGEDRRIDKPSTGTGEQHRRAWIGRGGSTSPSTAKVALADFGIISDLDVITPRGLGVFTTGGGLQFFHGGLSPQELVIPVLIVEAKEGTPDPKYQIAIKVAGDKISTGIVAVTLIMTGDLFTRESRVRIRLVQDGKPVAVAIGGDGLDHSTETVDASVDVPRIVSLRITADLLSGSSATLEVLDAATGIRLDAVDIDVAADIRLDNDLD